MNANWEVGIDIYFSLQASCPTIGHLGFLPRSNAHSQALTGRDLLCDFNDTLGLEPEITTTPHSVMEKLQLKSNFRV